MQYSQFVRKTFFLAIYLNGLFSLDLAEPIVITGNMVNALTGKAIENLRMCDENGLPIPFQVDEVTIDGEYVCDKGEEPNSDSGNGILDKRDEIVFLWEDCSVFRESDSGTYSHYGIPIVLKRGSDRRRIFINDNHHSVAISRKSYSEYDHEKQMVRTPSYYAQFGKDRFHFTRAGVKDLSSASYIDLTDELRVEIMLKALWGLIPIRYTEENIVCLVKRYKTGPIRLIRRGDFHLKLGLGIKGSRAAVNQICYPQIVKVPVYVHLPVRLKALFGAAYLEMTPVIKRDQIDFYFRIPQTGFSEKVSGVLIDTMINTSPNNEFMAVTDGSNGYGWLLQAQIADSLLEGSSFVFRRPSLRSGSADCGFRMTIRNLPKGYYEITNWVMFPLKSYEQLRHDFNSVLNPARVSTPEGEFKNRLSASSLIH